MVKAAFSILAVTAAAGIALTPVAASAATAGPAALAYSSSPAQAGPGAPEDTIVTFTVTSTGTLSITAPASVDLGPGAVDTTISGVLGGPGVTVTDNRGDDPASWTVTASSTDWTTGTATSTETIPAGDVTYDPGPITTTGVITTTGSIIALANSPTPGPGNTVVAGTAGIGNNSANWDPTISIAVPAGAVTGAYTGTLTQSVA
jgi:hypothetical protein